MSLGEKILKLRKQNGLSQEQLGEKINVTRQTISNWELNETAPNPDQLKLLSRTLKVSIDELLDNDISSVLVEKVSNTEKLAGIIIKILKFVGIAFIALLVIDVISLILYTASGTSIITKESTQVEMDCIKDKTTYMITIDTNENYTCDNCSPEMLTEIENIINYSDLDLSVRNIENYFESINGTCE